MATVRFRGSARKTGRVKSSGKASRSISAAVRRTGGSPIRVRGQTKKATRLVTTDKGIILDVAVKQPTAAPTFRVTQGGRTRVLSKAAFERFQQEELKQQERQQIVKKIQQSEQLRSFFRPTEIKAEKTKKKRDVIVERLKVKPTRLERFATFIENRDREFLNLVREIRNRKEQGRIIGRKNQDNLLKKIGFGVVRIK